MAKIICGECEERIYSGYMILNGRKVHYICYRKYYDAILEKENMSQKPPDIMSPDG